MKKYLHNDKKLKIYITKILLLIGITSERTKNISKQIILASFFKCGSIIANFMLVPLTINYLDTTNYGLWLTITSFIGWFAFFDIGIGNGLRNKFAEAKAKNDLHLARSYISTAYFYISLICITLTILIFIIINFVDWTMIFNTKPNLQKDLIILMYIVIGFFSLNLVFKLILTIYIADQKSSIDGLIQFIIQISSLITLWIITKITHSSLLLFGSIISGIPVLTLIILTILSFNKRYHKVRPNIKLVNSNHVKEIFGVGISFFIIQISCIILYATDNMIITHLYGPENVTPYNIAYKYFSIAFMIFNIVLAPYWSGITDAFVKEDFKWIKISMNNLVKFSLLFIIVTLFMLIISQFSYNFWVGNKVEVPILLSIFMCIYFCIIIFMQPFVFFINGVGKIRIQLIFSVLTALINIPLAIFFAKYLNLGVSGIILSTIFCSIPGIIYVPLQYNKIINRNAKGIWNK